MRGYRTPYLAIIQKQYVRAREASRRGDTKQRIREAVQVAYVAAKEASQDPRAVAIASAAAVALAMAWVAYSTHNPVSERDVQTALKYLYAPRRAYRLVRRYTTSATELGAYLQAADRCSGAYFLLTDSREAERVSKAYSDTYGKTVLPSVPLARLQAWLTFAVGVEGPEGESVAEDAIAEKRLKAQQDLLNWTNSTLANWADGVGDTILAKVAAVIDKKAKSLPTTKSSHPLMIAKDSAIDLAEMMMPLLTGKEIILHGGGFKQPGGLAEARKALLKYIGEGVPIKELDTYFKNKGMGSLIEEIERSIMSATEFPRRSVAADMMTYKAHNKDNKLQLDDSEVLLVDETEPCARVKARLHQGIFDDLDKAQDLPALVGWALAHVGAICTRQYGDLEHMRYVIGTIHAKVMAFCADTATYATADSMVYMALAMRVLGHSATSQYAAHERACEEARNWVFSAVVCVARSVARFARDRLGPPTDTEKRKPKRDLNLFYEPNSVSDNVTIKQYSELCSLLYEDSMLLYVAPGIERDASTSPLALALVLAGQGSINAMAGEGFDGRYYHAIPPAAKKDNKSERPSSAPYYLGGGSWGAMRAVGTMHALKSMLVSQIPTVPELAGMAVGAIPTGLYKTTIALWTLSRLWESRQRAAMVVGHNLSPQGPYVDAMFENTPYRALNVACAALTAQDTDPYVSRSSAMHMLDASSGHVRIFLDSWATYAGMDVAPTRIAPGLFQPTPIVAPERIMAHFSRGLYATSMPTVVGTSEARKAYDEKQEEYDRAIYETLGSTNPPQITLSLANRQYRKQVPSKWLADETAPATKPSVGESRSVFYSPESTAAPKLIPANQTGDSSTLSAIHAGLDVTIEQHSLGTVRIVHTDENEEKAEKTGWVCIVNPESAIRLQDGKKGPIATRDPMLRLLVAFHETGILPFLGVWSAGQSLMLTVPAREGTLRVYRTGSGVAARFGDSRYSVTTRYTPWSSLFFSHERKVDLSGSVRIHVTSEDGAEPSLVCIRYKDSALRVHVIRLLPSNDGLAPEQSAPTSAIKDILTEIQDSPCRVHVKPLAELLHGKWVSAAVPPDLEQPVSRVLKGAPEGAPAEEPAEEPEPESDGAPDGVPGDTMQLRWERSIGAARDAAQMTRDKEASKNPQNGIALSLASEALAALDESGTSWKTGRHTDLAHARARFEAATCKRVRDTQMETMEQALASFETPAESEIIPVLMGAGKSTVIIPMLALLAIERVKDDESGAVIVVAPQHLVEPMYLAIAVALTHSTRKPVLIRDTATASHAKYASKGFRAVCVLSGHKMQQFALDKPVDVYTKEFCDRTTMIFDEFDGLMDPLQCAFRRSTGDPKKHYLDVDMDSYYDAVLAVVTGAEPRAIGAAPGVVDDADSRRRRELLLTRITGLSEELKDMKVKRDFGLTRPMSAPVAYEPDETHEAKKNPIYAVPLTRGALQRDTYFSDPDVCAILTARLFIQESKEGAYEGTVYGLADLPVKHRNAVKAVKGDTAAECALVAMRTMETYVKEKVVAFVDIATMCKQRVAFSGTVDIPCVMPIQSRSWRHYNGDRGPYGWKMVDPESDVRKRTCDTLAKREFERVLRLAEQNEPIFIAKDDKTIQTAFAELARLVREDVRCVVDACGLFAGIPAREVVSKIVGAETGKTAQIQGVYMDEASKLTNGGCEGDACLYYFNQQNSRGTDIKMTKSIKGVVVMDYLKDTLTGTAQAAYRMRLLSKAIGSAPVHSLRFLVIGNPEVTTADKMWEVPRAALPHMQKGREGEDITGVAASVSAATEERESARASASETIVQRLKENEMELAKTRAQLHKTQEDAFAERVAKINYKSGYPEGWRTTSGTAYDVTTDPDAILKDASGTSALATSTSVSKSTADFRREPEAVAQVLSTWYRPTDTTNDIMVSWTGETMIMSQVFDAHAKARELGLSGQMAQNYAQITTFGPIAAKFFSASVNDGLLARLMARVAGVKEYAGYFPLLMCISPIIEGSSSGKVGHWTGYDPSPLECFPTHFNGKRYRMNLQHLVFIAQDGAIFSPKRDTKLTVNTTGASPVPMDPPATASLHLLAGHDAQSDRLNAAISAFSKEYGTLRLTTRMVLRHTRMTPVHCIVIVYEEGGKNGYVLATCADLLVKEIRELPGASVYFHGKEKVTIHDMRLKPKGEEPLDPALYLLASVGAVMSGGHQERVRSVMARLDAGDARGIIALACENSQLIEHGNSFMGSRGYRRSNPNSTAPSLSNAVLKERLVELQMDTQLRSGDEVTTPYVSVSSFGSSFGRTSTRKQRYI